MIWRLVLSFYFLSCVGSWGTDNKGESLRDLENDWMSTLRRSNDYTENDNKGVLLSDLEDDWISRRSNDYTTLELKNAATDRCANSQNMKIAIIDVLEHIKKNPNNLDALIQTLKLNNDQEPQIFRSDNNVRSDKTNSLFEQPTDFSTLRNGYKLNNPLKCVKEIMKLAESAYHAFLELKNTLSCLNILLPQNESTATTNPFNTEAHDVNTMIAIILKELEQYAEKPKLDQPSTPNPDWNIFKPTVPEQVYPSEPIKEVYIPSIEEILIKPELQRVTETPYISPQGIPLLPEYNVHEIIPGKLPITKPQQQTRPDIMQHPSIPAPPIEVNSAPMVFEFNSPQEYPRPELFGYGPSNLPIFDGSAPDHTVFPFSDIFESQPIYSNINAPSNGPIVDSSDSVIQNPTYFGPKPLDGKPYISNEPSAIYNHRPIYDDNNPMYAEPQPLYSNMVTLILQLTEGTPSRDQINNVMAILNRYQSVFKPKHYEIILALIDAYKNGLVDSKKINKILNFLLRPQTYPLWNDEKREILWHLLLSDKTGQIDTTNLDFIISLLNSTDRNPPSMTILEQLLTLLKPNDQGLKDHKTNEIILALLNQNKSKTLGAEQVKILLELLKYNNKERLQPKYIDILTTLAHWNEVPYLNAEHANVIFSLLKRNAEGLIDIRAVEIIHEIIFLKRKNLLTTEDTDTMFLFLKPDRFGNVKSKHLDIVLFILKNVSQAPELKDVFMKLLDPDVVDSKYVDILLSLNRERMLSIQLLEALITLLKQERTGQVDKYVIDKVLILLEPYKMKHPEIVTDIFKLLRGGKHPIGQPSSVDLLAGTNLDFNDVEVWNNPAISLDQLQESQVPVVLNIPDNLMEYNQNTVQTPQTFNLLPKILQMLQSAQANEKTVWNADKNGFIELTYMLHHEKPLIYQPIYYVKYKIPLVKFLSSVNSLNAQNVKLSDIPEEMWQNLLLVGNVSEVSPGLKGFQNEDILKLTFKDGDLVQAKFLDENSFNLNEQIILAHNLNTDVSPEDILQQSNMNSAPYYKNKEGFPDIANTVTINTYGGLVQASKFDGVDSTQNMNPQFTYSPVYYEKVSNADVSNVLPKGQEIRYVWYSNDTNLGGTLP